MGDHCNLLFDNLYNLMSNVKRMDFGKLKINLVADSFKLLSPSKTSLLHILPRFKECDLSITIEIEDEDNKLIKDDDLNWFDILLQCKSFDRINIAANQYCDEITQFLLRRASSLNHEQLIEETEEFKNQMIKECDVLYSKLSLITTEKMKVNELNEINFSWRMHSTFEKEIENEPEIILEQNENQTEEDYEDAIEEKLNEIRKIWAGTIHPLLLETVKRRYSSIFAIKDDGDGFTIQMNKKNDWHSDILAFKPGVIYFHNTFH